MCYEFLKWKMKWYFIEDSMHDNFVTTIKDFCRLVYQRGQISELTQLNCFSSVESEGGHLMFSNTRGGISYMQCAP